jgi:hypothetical protein
VSCPAPSPSKDAAAAASGRTTPRAAAGLWARRCRRAGRGAPRTAGRLDTAVPCARAGTTAPCSMSVAMARASRRGLALTFDASPFCVWQLVFHAMALCEREDMTHESVGAASGVGGAAGGASSMAAGSLPAPALALDAVVVTHSFSGSCLKSSFSRPAAVLSPGGATTTRHGREQTGAHRQTSRPRTPAALSQRHATPGR